VNHELESLWDLAAGRRSSLESPLDDLLRVLGEDSDLRAAANLEAVTTLREVLREVPATMAPEEAVTIPAQSAVLLAKLLLSRFR
jgi:hypothetical protein